MYASVVLDAIEVLDRFKRDDRQLRLAMLAGGLFSDPADLFDELRNIKHDDDEIDEAVDSEGNPIATRWDFSNAELNRTQAEVEEEIAMMLAAASSGVATLDEPTYGEWI